MALPRPKNPRPSKPRPTQLGHARPHTPARHLRRDETADCRAPNAWVCLIPPEVAEGPRSDVCAPRHCAKHSRETLLPRTITFLVAVVVTLWFVVCAQMA